MCLGVQSKSEKKKKRLHQDKDWTRMLDPKPEHRYLSGNIMDTAQNPYILGYCAVLCLVTQLCLFATPWTGAHQVPLSIGILQARILEWVAMSSSRGSSQPRFPVLQTDSLPTEPPGKPKNTGGVAYPFSSWSSWPRNWTGVSCTAGGFFYQLSYQEQLSSTVWHV